MIPLKKETMHRLTKHRLPAVFLYHDGRFRVPSARLMLLYYTATFYPGEGHFSTIANHAREIFHQLRG